VDFLALFELILDAYKDLCEGFLVVALRSSVFFTEVSNQVIFKHRSLHESIVEKMRRNVKQEKRPRGKLIVASCDNEPTPRPRNDTVAVGKLMNNDEAGPGASIAQG
jgi:hypothetical protein